MSRLRLEPGDETMATTCDWCGLGTRVEDLTETLDGSEVCLECIQHYDSINELVY